MRLALVAILLSCLALSQAACSRRGGGSSKASNSAGANANAPSAGQQTGGPHFPPLPADADARAYIDRGIEAYKKNYDGEAAEAFEQAVRLDPNSAEAHYRLGLAYAALGRDEDAERSFEAAVKEYKKAADVDEESPDAQYYLGLAYAKLGKWDEAVKSFKRSVRDEPEDTDRYYELGVAHSKLAQYREAVRALERALEIDENNFRAEDALERAREGVQRREDYLKQLEKMKQQQRKPGANTNANAATGAGTTATPTAPTPQTP
jgi:tetratricopeptide (TPR) repeat protein